MRVMGLDLGERRIGVALSDPTATIAQPLRTIERRSRKEDFATICALVAEHEVALVVVGMPLTLRSEHGPQARRIERYAMALAEVLPVPVQMWDERYSTAEAIEILQERGRRGRRTDVDAVAAAVILQSFLESRRETPC